MKPPQFKVTAVSSSKTGTPKKPTQPKAGASKQTPAAPTKPAAASAKPVAPKPAPAARVHRRTSGASATANVTIKPIGKKSTRPKAAKTAAGQTKATQQRTVVVPTSSIRSKVLMILLWIVVALLLILGFWYMATAGKKIGGGTGNNHPLPPPAPVGRPANVPPAPGQPTAQNNGTATNAAISATFNMHDNATVNMNVNGASGFNMNTPAATRPWPLGFTNYVRVDIAPNTGMQVFIVPPHSARMFMVAHGWRANLYTVASRDTYRLSINGVPPEQIDPNKVYEVRSYLVENLSSEELTIGFECTRVP